MFFLNGIPKFHKIPIKSFTSFWGLDSLPEPGGACHQFLWPQVRRHPSRGPEDFWDSMKRWIWVVKSGKQKNSKLPCNPKLNHVFEQMEMVKQQTTISIPFPMEMVWNSPLKQPCINRRFRCQVWFYCVLKNIEPTNYKIPLIKIKFTTNILPIMTLQSMSIMWTRNPTTPSPRPQVQLLNNLDTPRCAPGRVGDLGSKDMTDTARNGGAWKNLNLCQKCWELSGCFWDFGLFCCSCGSCMLILFIF